MSSQGIFITLEGGEGSGKSTQIKTLAAFLQDKGHDVILTREPGGTPEAEKIRELLVNRDGGDWTPMAETLLFFAARAMHIETLIKPALAEGKIVICDRFTDSTRAYQSYGHGLDPDIIESYVQLAIAGFEPDLTFILDIDAAAGLERAGRRNTDADSTEDRFEQMQIDFHERLRQGFLEIAARNPERCVIIDAQQSIDEIAAQIGDAALERISNV
ncbi:MAG: dTMP kinase [Rhodospirillales bacterium]|nr:dTMP kinase [Rhodospirillales bacterium]